MTYNYLDALREDTAAEPARLAGLLDMAHAEYKKCMAHDEEIAVPEGMPEEILRLLRHGRELALGRAQVVGEAITANVNRLPIDKVPEEYRSFHKDNKATRTDGLWRILNDGRE